METAAAEGLGFAHFLSQTDAVGKGVLLVLLVLSIGSWYLMVSRAIADSLMQRRTARFLERFWAAPSVEAARPMLHAAEDENPFAELARQAIRAGGEGAHGGAGLAAAGGYGELLTRVLGVVVELIGGGGMRGRDRRPRSHPSPAPVRSRGTRARPPPTRAG